jgi:hypothetical protein
MDMLTAVTSDFTIVSVWVAYFDETEIVPGVTNVTYATGGTAPLWLAFV